MKLFPKEKYKQIFIVLRIDNRISQATNRRLTQHKVG